MKIVYIISKIDKSFEFERTALGLKNAGYDLTIINLRPPGTTELNQFLLQHGISSIEINYTSKLQYLFCLLKVYRLLKKLRPDIVHCHLLDATLIGLMAAKLAGIRNRIYTRHHSTFHLIYKPHAVKYDKWANRNAVKILAVSSKVKEVLVNEEGVPADKVEVVDHGIDLNDFSGIGQNRIDELKDKYGIREGFPIIGSVSRYDGWKGVQFTIEAFSNLLKQYPRARLVLANAGKGDYKKEIAGLLQQLPKGSFVEIPFENDMPALYQCFHMVTHVPIDDHSEAFGQIYIEAMAARIPLIATRSGIGNYILDHLKNSYVVDYKNSGQILEGIIYFSEHLDQIGSINENAFELVRNNFSYDLKLNILIKIYQSLCP